MLLTNLYETIIKSAKQSLFKSIVDAKCLSTGLKVVMLLFKIDLKSVFVYEFLVKS